MPKVRPTRLLALAMLLAATAQAQMHHVEAPENVTRSVGVYEWTGDLAKPVAARLIPVSLFIDGGFEDGGTYYSRPVPLALDSGNIYFLEKAGVPQGTITLDYARHLQPPGGGIDDSSALGWFGYGTFATMPVPRKTPALHASVNPYAIVSSKDDDRPTFVRRATDDSKTAGAPDTDRDKKPGKTTPPAASVTPPPAVDDDPDRPHFSKPPATTTPAQTPSTTTPSGTSTTTTAPAGDSQAIPPAPKDPTDDTDRPTLRHRDPKQAEADRKARAHGSVSAMPGSLNDDPDRPDMRRGKTAGIGGDPAPQMTGMPKDLHQMIVVSDPTNREPHPFARAWATPTERADVLTKLEAIAETQIAAYVRRNSAPPPTPAPAKTKTRTTAARTRHTAPAKPAPAPPAAALSGEELTGYTLSYGGLPTFVYAALSAPPDAASGVAGAEQYVTLVAQQLPSGELQVAFSSVTDAAHLDRTPWFRLVDAVDPDASHRASLLFELRGHSSRQFALYRVVSAKADRIFVTNPTE
ncbi:MAG TPA: hypothetical protein VIJ79_08045 [Acidobacteriaceae bacterium]